MSTILERTRKQLPKFNRTQGNAHSRYSNIPELIGKIPKTIKGINGKMSFNMLFELSKNTCAFSKDHFPDRYRKRCFDPNKDTLESFTAELSDLVFDEGYTIGIEIEEFQYTDFFFEIPFDPFLYSIEAHFFEKMPNKGLKIGFAKLLLKYQNAFPYATLNSLTNEFFENHFLEHTVDYNVYSHDADSEEFNEGIETAKQWTSIFKRTSRLIKKYAEMDISILHTYYPRKEKFKKLKDLLLYGLELNPSVIHEFAYCHDDECDYLPASELFGVYYDTTSMFEEGHIEWLNDRGNNVGLSFPMGYYRYKKGKYVGCTDSKTCNDFVDLCSFLENFNSLLNNHFI